MLLAVAAVGEAAARVEVSEVDAVAEATAWEMGEAVLLLLLAVEAKKRRATWARSMMQEREEQTRERLQPSKEAVRQVGNEGKQHNDVSALLSTSPQHTTAHRERTGQAYVIHRTSYIVSRCAVLLQ